MENAVQTEAQTKALYRKVFWLAGFSSLLSGLLLVSAFLISNEELSRSIIFTLSPLLLLPVIPVLYRVFCKNAYELSRLTLIAGLCGMIPILVELLVTRIIQWIGADSLNPEFVTNMRTLVAGFSVLIGLWIIMTGHIGFITKLFPLGLSVTGLFTGALRIIIIGNLVLDSFNSYPKIAFSGLWNLGLIIWIASHLVWTGWLGIWLFQKKEISPLENDLGANNQGI